MVLIKIGKEEYHVDKKLMQLWNKNSLEHVEKYNTDRVYVIAGRERVGKTTWANQQMGAIEPSAFVDIPTYLTHWAFTPDEFDNAVRTLKNSVIIYDEAFSGLSSRSAMSRVNKRLIQTLMEMGQNNNIVFILLPSFFLLDVYPAMLRSDGLFHIEQERGKKTRVWKGYNRADKNKIYQLGLKKGWSYTMKSRYSGRFFPQWAGGEKYYKAYLSRKRQSLGYAKDKQVETVMIEEKYKEMTSKLLKILYETNFKSLRKLSDWLKENNFEISHNQIGKIMGGVGKSPVNQ